METLLNTTIKAFGWSIFHSLWQGALIYGLLFLILMTRTSLSAKLKHNLAFGAICLMFGSFLWTFVSILKIPTASLNISLAQQIQPQLVDEGSTSTLSFSVIAEQYFPYLVGFYSIGLIIQVAVVFIGYQKLERIKHAFHLVVPQDWNLCFQEVQAQLKLSKPIGFYLSDQVNVPLVIGFFKPVILFPISLATQLDLQQVEAILIHELSHIRRNDYMLNLVKTGIETILFFNPFVWLSSKFIRMEREHDCDDLVVQYTGTPLTYAHALLKIELIKDKQTPALSLAASGSSQHLYQRIKRITDMKTTYMNAKQRIFAVTLTLATIISLAWISPAKEKASVKSAAENVVNKVQQFAMSNTLQEELQLQKPEKITLAIDSPEKKKKIKIITVDEKGNRKEYNSINDLPDSLKDADNHIYMNNMNFPVLDSANFRAITSNIQSFTETFNTPEQHGKWEKLTQRMQKEAEAMEKKFNTPEERAKWEKLGDSMNKLSLVINKRLNSPQFNAEMKKLNNRLELKSKELRMMIPSEPAAPGSPNNMAPVEMKFNMKYDFETPESAKLKNSSEYKKLRKEFDEKVEKLKKKQEKSK